MYNEEPTDDLMPLDSMVPVRTDILAYKESRKIYYEFGQKCNFSLNVLSLLQNVAQRFQSLYLYLNMISF